MPNGVIDIEDNARSKCRNIELINLLLAEIGFGSLEKMGGDLRTDEESNLPIKKIERENTTEFGILFPEQNDGTSQKSEQSSEERRKGRDHRWQSLIGSGHYQEGNELSDDDRRQQKKTHIEKLAGISDEFHGEWRGTGRFESL